MRIAIFGPGPQFKGGMANYTLSLAKAFDKLGVETHIISWTQQYPAIIPRDFIDRSSRSNKLEGTNIQVQYLTNYNNPFTWQQTVNKIKQLNPEKVIFQWSIALQGLPMGYIARQLNKSGIEVIFDLHFVIQKEQSALDKTLTKYGIAPANTYVVHAQKTADELKELFPKKELEIIDSRQPTADSRQPISSQRSAVLKLYHPVYDMFTSDPAFDKEKVKKELNLRKHVFLFFGFIRKYKGLHHAIRAFAKVAEQRDDVSLLIVGESFWNTLDESKLSTKIKKKVFGTAKKLFLNSQNDEQNYRPLELIEELDIRNKVTLVNEYVSNEEVPKYFQVSDSILLFYEYATPSGVESMAYNFNLPILATNVGHFPETVKDGYNGYLAEAEDTDDMARAMLKSIEKPIPRENIAATAKDMSWENYAKAIMES